MARPWTGTGGRQVELVWDAASRNARRPDKKCGFLLCERLGSVDVPLSFNNDKRPKRDHK